MVMLSAQIQSAGHSIPSVPFPPCAILALPEWYFASVTLGRFPSLPSLPGTQCLLSLLHTLCLLFL